MKSQRVITFLLVLSAIVLLLFFFIGGNIQSGDYTTSIVWQFALLKKHLASELSLPYITPARCGGWLFLADAQSIVLSIYSLFAFVIPNAVWACKVGNLFMTILFGFGVFVWFKRLGITDINARIIAGALTVFSGSWAYHMSMGGLWMQGVAYIPWIMILTEKILELPVKYNKSYGLTLLGLIGLFFLIINSGYIWIQVFLPVFVFRLIVECISSWKTPNALFVKMSIIIGLGAIAILLSLFRLGAVYEYQMLNFPRAGGGVAPHYQIIGNTRYLIEMLVQSFFNANIVVTKAGHGMLGFMQDYTNFIGLAAIPALLIGIFRSKDLWKNKIFLALVLAAIGHLLFIRTTHVADLVRMIFPVLKSITWHWRGNIVLVFVLCVFIAKGYEFLFKSKHHFIKVLAVLLMLTNMFEIAYAGRNYFTWPLFPAVKEFTQELPQPATPLKEHYTSCALGCIFGYGNEYPKEISIKSSWTGGGDVSQEAALGYYNMHDVRKMFGAEGKGGYYLSNSWPLWPKTDAQEFDRYIHFKQVVPVSMRLKVMIFISAFAWLAYLLCWLCLWNDAWIMKKIRTTHAIKPKKAIK